MVTYLPKSIWINVIVATLNLVEIEFVDWIAAQILEKIIIVGTKRYICVCVFGSMPS